MLYIYNLLLYLILPLLPLRLWWKSRKNRDYRHRILERFASFNFPALKSSIWVHAVSVGEAIAAAPLIRKLIETYPNEIIVVTTMTPTGAQQIQKLFPQILQLYVPYDYPFIVKRFLKHIKPKILLLMETELWPNILYYSAQRKVPIILANARLSVKSFTQYKKVAGFIRSVLNHINLVLAQSKIDAKRFLALGLDSKKIVITGNIKFDLKVPNNICQQAKQLRNIWHNRPTWVAASTHPGEEAKILAAAKIVQQTLPDSLLILVPRHLERFTTVFTLALDQGFNVTRYTELQKYSPATNIVLGDVMGQLLLFYGASDVAFVGGSLITWGGHNLLEPAALAKPVLSGPNLSAFLKISQLLTAANALIIVADEKTLAQNVIQLFQNQQLREQLGTAALDVVEQHRGATAKILKHIQKFYEYS